MPRKTKKDFFGNPYVLNKLTEKQIKGWDNEKIEDMIITEFGKLDFFVILGALWHHLNTKGEWDLMKENVMIIENLLKLRNEQVDRDV